MYGFGVRCYLSFDWNRFDFFLVLCGMGEVIINPDPNPNPNPNPTLTLAPGGDAGGVGRPERPAQ